MLALHKVEEIRRLLDAGVAQRKIAQQVGVSRGTVLSISTGRRGLYGRESGEEESLLGDDRRPPERCPRCGALVYLPCVGCAARAFRLRRHRQRRSNRVTNVTDVAVRLVDQSHSNRAA